MRILIISVLISFLQCCIALIVPQEVPSILSLVYSTIPQVRKGTDSRLGFGFRLGDHADFQVMYELGPQKETRPIGVTDDSSSNSKRHIRTDDYLEAVEKSPNKEGTSYLMNWSNDMFAKKNAQTTTRATTMRPDVTMKKGIGQMVQITPLISESSLKQLQMLYKMAQNNTGQFTEVISVESSELDSNSEKKSSAKVNNIKKLPPTENKDKITAELMDVSLD